MDGAPRPSLLALLPEPPHEGGGASQTTEGEAADGGAGSGRLSKFTVCIFYTYFIFSGVFSNDPARRELQNALGEIEISSFSFLQSLIFYRLLEGPRSFFDAP